MKEIENIIEYIEELYDNNEISYEVYSNLFDMLSNLSLLKNKK